MNFLTIAALGIVLFAVSKSAALPVSNLGRPTFFVSDEDESPKYIQDMRWSVADANLNKLISLLKSKENSGLEVAKLVSQLLISIVALAVACTAIYFAIKFRKLYMLFKMMGDINEKGEEKNAAGDVTPELP